MLRKFLIGAAVAALAGPALAQTAPASNSVDVRVSLVPQLSVTPGSDLHFGTATVPTTSTSITIDTSGTRTAATGTTLLSTNAGAPGSFTLGAPGGSDFNVALSTSMSSGWSLSDLKIAGCGFAANTAWTSITGVTPLSGTGVQTCTLSVGGTLGIPANPTPGDSLDIGNLTATVSYP